MDGWMDDSCHDIYIYIYMYEPTSYFHLFIWFRMFQWTDTAIIKMLY